MMPCCGFFLEVDAESLRRKISDIFQCSGRRQKDVEKQKLLNQNDDKSGVQYNIVYNPRFVEGTQGWFGQGCSLTLGNYRGSTFCIATERKETWHGLAQDITKRLEANSRYRVEAWVGISGQADKAPLDVTVKVENSSGGDDYMLIKSMTVTKGKWSLLTGMYFTSEVLPKKATLYLEGPCCGVDVLVKSVAIIPSSLTSITEAVERATQVGYPINGAQLSTQERDIVTGYPIRDNASSPPQIKDPKYGVNIVNNSNLKSGLYPWYAMGNCSLKINSGGPLSLGPSAENSFIGSSAPSLSGKFLHVSNRTETWEGPAQNITDKIQLFNSYQITAWVCIASPAEHPNPPTPQIVSVSINVNGEWFSGAEVLASARWTEVSGSFRLETNPKEVVVYIQGPSPGVEVMVAGLEIFAVDRLARKQLLQEQTDKVRKRDVAIRLRDSKGQLLPAGTPVSIRQTKNDFPIGTCINRSSLNNKVYKHFFLDYFNWAVFENELKWDQTEPKQGVLRYDDADAMLKFCKKNKIPVRGHCILWEVQENLPKWVQKLEGQALADVVHNRITGLLTRYKDQFEHYDVNNEMLHGSFYKERLGSDYEAKFFKLARQLDGNATLFVNDYHVTDGYDSNSSPQEYVELIRSLQSGGADIGGIGLQCHIDVPVGPIISEAFNKLSSLEIPIWLTELDVSSVNEFVRAEDLEVVFREAFAHPSVEGCFLWGFMENAMYRENAHLVDSNGRVTEAGKRLMALKKEWLTNFDGVVDDNGEVLLRGFHGNYTLSVSGRGVYKTFDVTKGDGVSELDLTI